jgi:hypothetical protein
VRLQLRLLAPQIRNLGWTWLLLGSYPQRAALQQREAMQPLLSQRLLANWAASFRRRWRS